MAALPLLSCGHVSIYDKEVCIDEGSLGAHCAHVLTGSTRDISPADWDNMRFGRLSYDPGDDAQMKLEEEELCSIKGVTCDYQTKQAIHNIFAKVAYLKHHAKARR